MHANDRWHHIIINTHCSWLPGDPRGFHSRGHRIHSSGDYRTPPPPGEHEALYQYHQARSGSSVVIPGAVRPTAGEALIRKVVSQGHDVLMLSIGGMHAHLLVKVPPHPPTIKRIAGTWKQAASLAMPIKGKVWSEGCDSVLIRDEAHQQEVFDYIRRHIEQGAWVRHFRDGGYPPLRPPEAWR